MTIRNLDPTLKHELRKLAAARGVSMEQEVRDRLASSVGLGKRRKPIFDELTRLAVKPADTVDLKNLSNELWEEGLRWPPSS